MSGPVKFDKKKQIVKPAENHPYNFLESQDYVKQDIRLGRVDFELSQRIALTHLDTPKTKKFDIYGPVKFDEKSQIVKRTGNYPY